MTAPRIQADTKPVLAAFDQLAHSVADVSEPCRTVLAIGLDEARAGAPVRTGELAGSLSIDVTPQGGELAAAAPYAVFVDRGTRYVRARRFMARGAAAMDRATEPTFGRWLAGAVDQAAK